MGDDIIIGIFGVAAAIVGAFSGVAILKIWDSITATRERKRYRTLLRIKLTVITVMINNLTITVNRADKIQKEDFTIINEFLLRNGINEDISTLESLTEKSFKFNFDEKENEYLAKLIHLKFGVNQLLYSETLHAKEPIPDEKGQLLTLLTEISNDLRYILEYVSKYK
jgi:hypothetical protein